MLSHPTVSDSVSAFSASVEVWDLLIHKHNILVNMVQVLREHTSNSEMKKRKLPFPKLLRIAAFTSLAVLSHWDSPRKSFTGHVEMFSKTRRDITSSTCFKNAIWIKTVSTMISIIKNNTRRWETHILVKWFQMKLSKIKCIIVSFLTDKLYELLLKEMEVSQYLHKFQVLIITTILMREHRSNHSVPQAWKHSAPL